MADDADKGKAIKIGLAVACLAVAGYLIAGYQGWVPLPWGGGNTVKPPEIKMNEQQKKDLEKAKKQYEEAPPEEKPGA